MVDDVVGLLAEHGDDAKLLAGGQSLVPMMAMRLVRVGHVIDLNCVPALTGVTVTDGEAVVGATTRHAEIGSSEEVRRLVPALAEATPLIGHFQIRNRGTLGGSLAHADPAAEYPAVALALDARLDVAGPRGNREIGASEFFTGTWSTALEPDEVLVAARFPVWGARSGFAVAEVARRAGDFAIAGAVCGVHLSADGRVDRAAISLLGMGPVPVRVPQAAEQALFGISATKEDLTEIGHLAVDELEPPEDLHASRRYRTTVGAHLVARALATALARAGNGGT